MNADRLQRVVPKPKTIFGSRPSYQVRLGGSIDTEELLFRSSLLAEVSMLAETDRRRHTLLLSYTGHHQFQRTALCPLLGTVYWAALSSQTSAIVLGVTAQKPWHGTTSLDCAKCNCNSKVQQQDSSLTAFLCNYLDGLDAEKVHVWNQIVNYSVIKIWAECADIRA